MSITFSGNEPIDDALLIEKCKSGDGKYFLLLRDRHRKIMQTTALRIVKSREAADDVVQEVLYRIHKGLGTFNGKCKLSTWIYRIARNESLRYLEKESNRAELPLERLEKEAARHPGALEGLIRQDQEKSMMRSIDALPADFREAVDLHYFKGLKLEEIAAKLGVPRGTVHSRIGRARALLKKEMARQEKDPF
jgi:RNA polymerase sigma-70 factor, ECF subfamily